MTETRITCDKCGCRIRDGRIHLIQFTSSEWHKMPSFDFCSHCFNQFKFWLAVKEPVHKEKA